jgi:multiple sugar transport system permease protein
VSRRWKEAGLAYLLLAPSLAILGLFSFLPLARALRLSLTEWRLAPGPDVGLRNYHQALTADPDFWHALGVTLWYVVATVPPALFFGYLIAELLHQRIRGRGLYRTLFFVPYVLSPVAAGAVWRWIFNSSYGLAPTLGAKLPIDWLRDERGVFAVVAQQLQHELPAWAAGPSVALLCIAAATLWQSLGFAVVILLAGMTSVPPEVVEAAQLDGATGWTLARRVRLPLLSPAFFFLTVVLTIRVLQLFTQVYVLSIDHQGGPAGTTRSITLYIYQCFNELQPRLGPGYGSAVALLLFLLVLAVTAVQFRVLGRRVHYG